MGRKNRPIPSELFCDASFLIAYFATQDREHAKAMKIRERLQGRGVRLYSSWPIFSEASTLLLYHYGYSHSMALLQSLSAFHCVIPSEADYYKASALFGEFNRDQRLSFNDLLVYVLIRGNLRGMPVITFDRDFAKIGLTLFRP